MSIFAKNGYEKVSHYPDRNRKVRIENDDSYR
jgi:hypothetical protein